MLLPQWGDTYRPKTHIWLIGSYKLSIGVQRSATSCWPCNELAAHWLRVFLSGHPETVGLSSRNRRVSDHDVGLLRTCKALVALRTRPGPNQRVHSRSSWWGSRMPGHATGLNTAAAGVFALHADDELNSFFSPLPDSPLSVSLLLLYILLGVAAGALLLCWCCWSPGWFVWRVSICRFLPCCNSVCASCQLCARSCSNSKEHRLAKVSPHTPTNGASAAAAAITHSADENVNMSAV